MPNIGSLHPQVVHFVVASLFLGLPIYWLGFLPRPQFLRPMASVLLLVGTAAAFAAVRSGADAHGVAEALPDTRNVVVEHEELGQRTRNIFAGVLLLELLALGLAFRSRASSAGTAPFSTPSAGIAPTALRVAVGIAWAVGAFQLFETAEHGGELVYEYAGGIGYRTGDSQDIAQLLRAGLFAQSRVDREAGRPDEAARLVEEMAVRFPVSVEVQLLSVESKLVDTQDSRGALETLAGLTIGSDNPRMLLRRQTYAFDAYMLLEMPDSARAALDALPPQLQENRTVVQRRERLLGG